MNGFRTLVVLTLAMSVGVGLGPNLPAEASGPVAEEIVWRAVMTDCATNDEGKRGLLALSELEGVEAMLADLLNNGPAPERIEAQGEMAGRRWDRRQEFLAGSPQTGLDPVLLDAIAEETREDYVDREIMRLIDRARDRAAAILAAIGSDEAMDLLDQARYQGGEALRDVVDRAVEQFADGGSLKQWRRAPQARQRGARRSGGVR